MTVIATIVGARPQFIKAAITSRAISERPKVRELLIHTGQHFDRNMSAVFFEELQARQPDINLGIGGGTHGQNTGRMLEALERVLKKQEPDWVLVFGDTDSTLAGALAAVKLHIPIAHVEAGLRSFNRQMPEEINRVLTDHAANLLFAPTQMASRNLRNEGIHPSMIRIVGDVMYDASIHYKEVARRPATLVPSTEGKPFFLFTLHRAENTDDRERLQAIVDLINSLAKNVEVIFPIHPRTAGAIDRLGSAGLSSAVTLIEPVGFLEMAWLLRSCQLVVTDSGGLQKEAYFNQKPCVTLRDETEWTELVEAGWNCLISPLSNNAISAIHSFLSESRSDWVSLYGGGDAGNLIIDCIESEHRKICQI